MPTYNNTTRFALRKPQINQKVNDFTAIIDALADDVDAKLSGYSSGLLSARGSAAIGGRFFYSTDALTLAYSDGSAWRIIPLGAPARAFFAAGGSLGAGPVAMPLDTKSFDPDNAINLTSDAYFCPRTGAYHVDGQLSAKATVAGQSMTCALFRNGSGASQGSNANDLAVTETADVSVSDSVSCTAGDYLQLYASSSAGMTLVAGAGVVNYLTVQPLC